MAKLINPPCNVRLVIFAAVGFVDQHVVAVALQHLAHGVLAGGAFADSHASTDFGFRLDGPLLGVGFPQKCLGLRWVALDTDLSLVAHLAVLIFSFADCSHGASCVWSAKCDGTRTGWREKALLRSVVQLCRLL